MTCRQRRRIRESPQIEELRSLRRGTRSETQRKELQQATIDAKRHIACTIRQIFQINKFVSGTSINRSKKLHTITCMLPPESSLSPNSVRDLEPSYNSDDRCTWLGQEYGNTWRCHETERLQEVDGYLLSKQLVSFDIAPDEVSHVSRVFEHSSVVTILSFVDLPLACFPKP